MKLKDEDGWKRSREANTDPNGKAALDFAEAWADEMEARMEAGAKLEDIAEESSMEVDSRPGFGITGFMYGFAVSLLAQCWEHGEELRRWHNLDVQIGTEGEEANRTGGTLNPALLNVQWTKS